MSFFNFPHLSSIPTEIAGIKLAMLIACAFEATPQLTTFLTASFNWRIDPARLPLDFKRAVPFQQ